MNRAVKQSRLLLLALTLGSYSWLLLLAFLFLGLRRDPKRALHAAGHAADSTADNATNRTADWPSRFVAFASTLASALLRAADHTLRICRNRHRQYCENAGNNPSFLHVRSPR